MERGLHCINAMGLGFVMVKNQKRSGKKQRQKTKIPRQKTPGLKKNSIISPVARKKRGLCVNGVYSTEWLVGNNKANVKMTVVRNP